MKIKVKDIEMFFEALEANNLNSKDKMSQYITDIQDYRVHGTLKPELKIIKGMDDGMMFNVWDFFLNNMNKSTFAELMLDMLDNRKNIG
ncbi:MAG: hypothetical protein WDZ80_03745 [Candidatus Paceibacterota bacterium]